MKFCRSIRFAGVHYWPKQSALRRGRAMVHLRHKTALLLDILLSHAGQIITLDKIAQRLWPNVTVDYENGARVAMFELRQAIESIGGRPTALETCPGKGYRIAEPVSGALPTNLRQIKSTPFRKSLIAVVLLVLTFSFVNLDSTRQSEFAAHSGGNHSARELLLSALSGAGAANSVAWEAAIDEIRAVIKNHPNFARAYFEKAQLLLASDDRGLTAEALDALDTAITLDPANPDYHINRALAHWRLTRNWHAVEADFEVAVQLAPRDWNARIHLARFYTLAGQFAKAGKEIEMARSINVVEVSSRDDIGWLFLMAGDTRSAKLACDEASAANPHSMGTSRCYIDLNLLTGEKDLTINYMRSYLAIKAGLEGMEILKSDLDPQAVETMFWQDQARAWNRDNPIFGPEPVFRAIALAYLGDQDKAVEEIAAAYRNGSYYAPFIRHIMLPEKNIFDRKLRQTVPELFAVITSEKS